jgi:hypothetical protein
VSGEGLATRVSYLSVSSDKFCITPELLRDVWGKEDSIMTYEGRATKSYSYDSMGVDLEVDFRSGVNKNCAKKIGFDSDFFSRMEK